MQTAEVVLSVLRDRGRKGLPCTQLYRQMFNLDPPTPFRVYRCLSRSAP